MLDCHRARGFVLVLFSCWGISKKEWCPVCKNTRTMMTVVNGAVYLRFSRAA